MLVVCIFILVVCRRTESGKVYMLIQVTNFTNLSYQTLVDSKNYVKYTFSGMYDDLHLSKRRKRSDDSLSEVACPFVFVSYIYICQIFSRG